MPTATATTTSNSPAVISLKASSTSSSSTVVTLRSLYPRAARAFLQRNVCLTHSLLTSAFSIIQPPESYVPDSVASHRRKWDILRITFETTLYASPPPSQNPEDLPASLRANLMLSPEPLIATLHNRSLQLFTPSFPAQKPTSAFLPAQILVTLVLASLKLECTTVGRSMIEDWLARRSQEDSPDDRDGYAKVLELYCLYVLPRLEEWDYAEEFLQYERELSSHTRKYIQSSLHNLHLQAMSTQRVPSPRIASPSIPSPSPQSSRSVSPSRLSPPPLQAPPLTPPRPHTTPRTSLTTKSRTFNASYAFHLRLHLLVLSVHLFHRDLAHRHPYVRALGLREADHVASKIVLSLRPLHCAHTPPPSPTCATASGIRPTCSVRARAPASYADAVLQGASRARLTAIVVFCIVLPLLSFVFRVRRLRLWMAPSTSASGGGTAEEVRRRLRSAALVDGKGGAGNAVRRVWAELVRAMLDTVQMGGRGLV
ncbi:hypothetical protein B0H21DRAFT_819691 [Amylocystis lapponica]|nr:hypothetical protein B0H21DRAFT_819691 [Amylocystis lapponica]